MSRNQLNSDDETYNRSESVISNLSVEGRPIILENGTMHQGSVRKNTYMYTQPKIIETRTSEYLVPSRIQILHCGTDSMSSVDNENVLNTDGLHADYNGPSKNNSRRSSEARSESSYFDSADVSKRHSYNPAAYGDSTRRISWVKPMSNLGFASSRQCASSEQNQPDPDTPLTNHNSLTNQGSNSSQRYLRRTSSIRIKPRRRGADIPSRRQSFLYRNEASEADKLANLVSEQLANVPGYKRQASVPVCIEPNNDPNHSTNHRLASVGNHDHDSSVQPIITPFVQILAALRNVDEFLERIANEDLKNDQELDMRAGDARQDLAWCLDQLHKIELGKSVADMTSQKYRQIMTEDIQRVGNAHGADNDKTRDYLIANYFKSQEDDYETSRPSTTHSRHNSKSFHGRSASDRLKLGQNGNFGELDSGNLESGNFSPDGKHSGKNFSDGKFSRSGSVFSRQTSLISPGNMTRRTSIFQPISKISNHPLVKPELSLLNLDLELGVEVKDPEKVKKYLENGLNDWDGIDFEKFDKMTGGRPLTCLAWYILNTELQLLDYFDFDKTEFFQFLLHIEAHYNKTTTYHTNIHAADVTHSTFCLISINSLNEILTPLEKFAAILSAVIHDVDHTGYNNVFLENTTHELALNYNDQSVQENHHLSTAFKLMTCEGMNTITKKLQEVDDEGNSEWKIFRNFVINMVLGTDMNKHPETLAHLKTLTELKLITTNELGLDKPQDRLMILKNVLHCADLGNPTKTTKTYTWWADQVMKEFWAQGDAEKLKQMTVSRGFDRNDSNMASMQIGFIDYVVLPYWETFATLLPCQLTDRILSQITENREHYVEVGKNVVKTAPKLERLSEETVEPKN